MRVLQLIDSLRSGGAERMSVNYANALVNRIESSFLCCTRMEGSLKAGLNPEVGYIFLKKKNVFDLKAFAQLLKFVRNNNINIIQAHGNSWFWGLLIKLSVPGIKLVWHDHWGGRIFRKNNVGLKLASSFFDSIFAVNLLQLSYLRGNFHAKKFSYVKNFAKGYTEEKIILKGDENFKIIQTANFRVPKDHLNLLAAFKILIDRNYPVDLHLVGKDNEDSYSNAVKKYISDNGMNKKVFIYGEQDKIYPLLNGANLGVLSSESEGLPVAILEYALAGLPVVCTEVGDCPQILGKNGILVPPQNYMALAKAMIFYIENEQKRNLHRKELQNFVINEYSEEKILDQVLLIFNELLKVE